MTSYVVSEPCTRDSSFPHQNVVFTRCHTFQNTMQGGGGEESGTIQFKGGGGGGGKDKSPLHAMLFKGADLFQGAPLKYIHVHELPQVGLKPTTLSTCRSTHRLLQSKWLRRRLPCDLQMRGTQDWNQSWHTCCTCGTETGQLPGLLNDNTSTEYICTSNTYTSTYTCTHMSHVHKILACHSKLPPASPPPPPPPPPQTQSPWTIFHHKMVPPRVKARFRGKARARGS